MEKEELIRRLMKTFIAELEEYVETLNHDLLGLERGPDPAARAEIFKSLFRTGHSLKGTARSMSIEPLAVTGHHLESVFSAVRDGAVPASPALYELLFAVVDGIKDAARRLGMGEDVAKGPLTTLMPQLEAASREPFPSATMPVPAKPAAAPLPPVPVSAAPVPAASREPPPAEIAAAPAGDAAFVRISAARLDRLIALGGELRVVQSRTLGRDTDVERLLSISRRWQAELRASEKSLREIARRRTTVNDPAVKAATQLLDVRKENLQWMIRQLEQLGVALAADRKALEQIAMPLDREVMRSRMMPFADACAGMDRTVRDLARHVGKDVSLSIEGGKIEIDRMVVAAIKDPMLHLVRNAVDHGIETPAERLAAGKPARGHITFAAALRQGRVEIIVADDGRGFDLAAIRAKAARQGMAVPDDDAAAARLAFAHGFSTSGTVTEISGRGVGLDVVKTAIEAHRGTCDIAFTAGRGTRFILTVPLTLTRLHALLVSAGGRTYAFDSAAVHGLRRVAAEDLSSVEGRDMLNFAGAPVPVFRLTDVLEQATEIPASGGKLSVVVVAAGADRVAFTVDQLLLEQEVVVKDLGPRLPHVNNLAGATILPNGQIALILNAADLVQSALGRAPSPLLADALGDTPAAARKRLLIVDDSITTRTLVKSILESSGYDVVDAADGMEAWQLLQEHGADLVVSDVEMPRMDGFGLTEAIRASKRLRDLPVILVTALEAEHDRMRGLSAGADAYLPKSAFDQTNLLQTIAQLL